MNPTEAIAKSSETIADGINVKEPAQRTYDIVEKYVPANVRRLFKNRANH